MSLATTCRLSLPLIVMLSMLSLSVARAQPVQDVDRVLDAFHQAAAEADFASYTALMTEDIVFLGTDASERWQGDAFRDFARPHFESGTGWRYVPEQRSVLLSSDGRTAWFDELLQHDKLGRCRGSGLLLLQDGQWKIAQYNLSVPVPNELVYGVADDIADFESGLVPPTDASAEDDDAVAAGEEQASECRRKRHKTNRKAGC